MNILSGMEMVILSGPQAGAHIAFHENSTILMGSDFNNDIILRDPLIQDQQLKLELSQESVTLKVLSGKIILSNKVLTAGDETQLAAYVPVKIGDTIFAYGELESEVWDELIPGLFSEDNSQISQDEQVLFPAEQAQKTGKSFNSILLPAMLVIFAIASSIMLSRPDNVGLTDDQRISSIEEFLKQDAFQGLKLEKDAEGQWMINGYLTGNTDNARLDAFIAEQDIKLQKNIQVGEQLLAQVKDIYRLNNVEAEVQLIEQGNVKVSTAEHDVDALKQIEQIAYRDLPHLQELVTENVPVNIVNDVRQVKQDPGSIVTMIVPGDPGYLVTSNKSRYFEGAILPTGHKISSIAQDEVFLVKAGVETLLKF